MKILKWIIYTILGLLIAGTVALVGIILYAEYSGRRFDPKEDETIAEVDFSDGDSRLVYDENGNLAEMPAGTSEEDTGTGEDISDNTAVDQTNTPDTAGSPAEETAAADTTAPASNADAGLELPYVMDMGSALFHTADCPYAENISSDNRSERTAARERIIDAGYSPCPNCNP